MKIAMVSGLAGELGSYLLDILLEQGYEVHAVGRGAAPADESVHWHAANLTNYPSVARLIREIEPDEFYHLEDAAAGADDENTPLQEHVGSTHTVLQVLRDIRPQCRFVLRSGHEIYGDSAEEPVSEEDKFYPQSTAAIAQMAAIELVRHFRRDAGLHASAAVLFPHASARSAADHPLRRVTAQVARIKLGLGGAVELDGLCRRVDWGHTADYAWGLWLMAQAGDGDDYVLASGQTHTVREGVHTAFSCVGLEYWPHVSLVEDDDNRWTVPDLLMGDAAKAGRLLGWRRGRRFRETVVEMVRHDIEELAGRPLELQAWQSRQQASPEAGYGAPVEVRRRA